MSLSVDDIQKIVAFRRRITLAEIRGPARHRVFSWPRQEAMRLCRRFTRASLPAIGRRFGNRDHTTVLHAVQRVDFRCRNSNSYGADFADLEALCARLAVHATTEICDIAATDARPKAWLAEAIAGLAAAETVIDPPEFHPISLEEHRVRVARLAVGAVRRRQARARFAGYVAELQAAE